MQNSLFQYYLLPVTIILIEITPPNVTFLTTKNNRQGTRFLGPLPENLLAKVRVVEESLDQPTTPSLTEMSGLPVIGKVCANSSSSREPVVTLLV